MVPLATFIVILVFSAGYLIDKLNLFRRSSNVINIDFFTIKASLAFFEFSLLIYILGYIYWDYTTHFDSKIVYRVINFVNLVMVIIYLTWSYNFGYANVSDWGDDYCVNKIEYAKYKRRFIKTYKSQNAATAFCSTPKDAKDPYSRIKTSF